MCSKNHAIAYAKIHSIKGHGINHLNRIIQYRIPYYTIRVIIQVLYLANIINHTVMGLIEYAVKHRLKLLTWLATIGQNTETSSSLIVPRTTIITHLETQC